MKFVVLSFDDARDDFYKNVFPILKRESISATLNYISGFDSSPLYGKFNICSIHNILEMSKTNIEIANHTFSHLSKITNDDIIKGHNSLVKANIIPLGLAIPYNQNSSKEIKETCCSIGYEYIRHGQRRISSSLITILNYAFWMIFKTKVFIKRMLLDSAYSKKDFSNKENIFSVYSICFNRDLPISFYESIITSLKDKKAITLQFHSVFDSIEEINNSDFPNGAILTSELEQIIYFIKKQKNVCVSTQSDVCCLLKK